MDDVDAVCGYGGRQMDDVRVEAMDRIPGRRRWAEGEIRDEDWAV